MADQFRHHTAGLPDPGRHGLEVTPSDTVNLAQPARCLYIGTGGVVTVVMYGGETVPFRNVPNGTVLPVMARRVMSSGTTASDIIAIW